VLVVAIKHMARELSEHVLAECHAHVLGATTRGKHSPCGTRRPDVLVSDIGLPDVDGTNCSGGTARGDARAGGYPRSLSRPLARSVDRTRHYVWLSGPSLEAVEPSELVVNGCQHRRPHRAGSKSESSRGSRRPEMSRRALTPHRQQATSAA